MKAITYYRVSTDRQGKSGLGLEAQQDSVKRFISDKYNVLNSYIEIESGKNNHRPELHKAVEECKKNKAVLIIAKLDRLSRNVAFISSLMDAGIEFIAVDNPQANKLMIHILAAFAEHEREQISIRTKDALKAAKQRGVKLGNPQIAANNQAKAQERALKYKERIQEMRANGLSYNKIAKELGIHRNQLQRWLKWL